MSTEDLNATRPNLDPLTAYRVDNLERNYAMLSDNITKLSENVAKLTSLELKYHESRDAQVRAFAMLEKHDARILTIERELPTLKMARGWVITGATSMVGIFALFAVKTVFPAMGG